MIKAVIFDMDGLLINSEPLWREAEINVLGKRGIQLSDEDCRKSGGMRIDEVIQYWSEDFPYAKLNVPETIQAVMDEVSRLIIEKGTALPGVYQTLSYFKNRNFPMALASASKMELINIVIDKLKIRDYFSVVQSAEHMDFGKPNPQIFIETAKLLNVSTYSCLVFEDSLYGVIAAKAAKMKVVAIPELVNYNKKEFALADMKIASLEWFSESMFQLINSENM